MVPPGRPAAFHASTSGGEARRGLPRDLIDIHMLVPGQVISASVTEIMQALDIRKIHGY
jgi:hypothetical protein